MLQRTSKLLYADKVWRIINFFNIKRGSWIYIYTKYYLILYTNYVGKNVFSYNNVVSAVAIDHWSDGKHNTKVRTVN